MFLDVSCTITGMDKHDWERLGQRIVQRRVELGMRTREQFSERTKLSTRLLQDLENGKRLSYSQGTLAVVERALEWKPGSCRDVLVGLPARPTETPHQSAPPDTPPTGGVTNWSIARLLTTSSRGKEAAERASAAGSSETDLISNALATYEAAVAVSAEHFGGAENMGSLASALQRAQEFALQHKTTRGDADESTSETTQESVPEDAREDGDPRTPTTDAANRRNVTPLNRPNPGQDLDLPRAASDRRIETEDGTPGD
jgi:hypothetical protein